MGIKIFRELFRTADARKITIVALIGSILIGQFFSSFFPSLFCNSDKFYDEVAVLYN